VSRHARRAVGAALQVIGAAALVWLVLAHGACAPAPESSASAQPQPPEQPEEFVPIAELPPEEQLPAAPLLVTAYAFVWAVSLVYMWSIWRRLATVEKELAEVARRTQDQQRSL